MAGHRIYRAVTLLYPLDFRSRYRDDLVQAHADVIRDRGPAAGWARTTVDLVVTLPRYRLESFMNERQSSFALNLTVGALLVAGLAAIPALGTYPGVVLIALAATVAVTQRTRIARAIRVPNTDRRRRRLATAAVCGVIAVASLVVGFADLGNDDQWNMARLFVYNLVFAAGAVATFGYLIAGILTPRSGHDDVEIQPVA
ncbi:MAG: hypothetical protein ACR2H3_13400 [Acidimicrobiales bacterium]